MNTFLLAIQSDVFSRIRASSFALSLVLVGMSSPAEAKDRTWWVSPSGDDSQLGTQRLPWRSIQFACEEAKPGDTVKVLPGTYNEQIFVEVEGNAEDGPITFEAVGNGVIISAMGLDEDNVIYIEDKSYLTFIGFEIRDLKTKDGSGIRFEGSGSHLEFRNCKIHNIKGKNAMGITVYASSEEAPVSNLIIDGNEIFDCDAAPSEALTLNGNVTDFEVTNNHVHDVDGIGIDFIGGEQSIVGDASKVARNGICRGNTVARARSSYEGGWGAGIYVDGGQNILIEKNRVTECDLGIEIGAENKGIIAKEIIVRENLIIGNDKAGLVFGGYEKKAGRVEECIFEDNIIAANTSHQKSQAELWIQWASNNLIHRNTIQGDGSGPLLAADAKEMANTLTENVWFIPTSDSEKTPQAWKWWGKDYSTLETYQTATGNDSGSSFEKVDLTSIKVLDSPQ